MYVTTNGGQSWVNIAPPTTNAQFAHPFVMDPGDAKHLMTAGREVVETVYGPNTNGAVDGSQDWATVYDLGTRDHPGDANASSSASDPANKLSAIGLVGDSAYIGFCGVCDIINTTLPFRRGLATNVGGSVSPKRMTSNGWHIAAAAGLPNRYITSVAVDPDNPRTVYVALGGYTNRQWVPPGSFGDANTNIGTGHVYKSTDAGETFFDISAGLPDAPA